jgi:signal transduction histidine kinase
MPVLMSDAVNLTGLWPFAAGAASSLCCLAILALWLRRRSVLGLWLMVVMCASVVEMLLISFPVPARYSLGWYSGRVCGFLSGSLVLIVLLYEITTLYGRLLAAVVARRREREARLVTGDAVSASIAHEVRQPLSGMITNADAGLRWLDRATPDIEEAKAAFQRIVVDGHRAGALIGSVRAIFKKGVETRTALDINELVWEALSLARSDLQRHRISIEAVRKEQLPPVSGDPVQLRQVLLNLITNAVDAMAQQNGPRVLRVRSALREPDGVMVSVEDTGPGIEPAHLERIFSPHFTTKSNGMGLGLSICRSIVEAHGGRLWAAANRSRGAAVRFVLPAKA